MVHTHGVEGSTPPLATLDEYPSYGILAQLGEHLPYKQRVIGSSPIGPIFAIYMVVELKLRFLLFGLILSADARVAELADAQDLKSCCGDTVPVRFRSRALTERSK